MSKKAAINRARVRRLWKNRLRQETKSLLDELDRDVADELIAYAGIRVLRSLQGAVPQELAKQLAQLWEWQTLAQSGLCPFCAINPVKRTFAVCCEDCKQRDEEKLKKAGIDF